MDFENVYDFETKEKIESEEEIKKIPQSHHFSFPMYQQEFLALGFMNQYLSCNYDIYFFLDLSAEVFIQLNNQKEYRGLSSLFYNSNDFDWFKGKKENPTYVPVQLAPKIVKLYNELQEFTGFTEQEITSTLYSFVIENFLDSLNGIERKIAKIKFPSKQETLLDAKKNNEYLLIDVLNENKIIGFTDTKIIYEHKKLK